MNGAKRETELPSVWVSECVYLWVPINEREIERERKRERERERGRENGISGHLLLVGKNCTWQQLVSKQRKLHPKVCKKM